MRAKPVEIKRVRCPICHTVRPFYLYQDHVRQCQEKRARTMPDVAPLVYQVESAMTDAGMSDSYADLAGDIS